MDTPPPKGKWDFDFSLSETPDYKRANTEPTIYSLPSITSVSIPDTGYKNTVQRGTHSCVLPTNIFNSTSNKVSKVIQTVDELNAIGDGIEQLKIVDPRREVIIHPFEEDIHTAEDINVEGIKTECNTVQTGFPDIQNIVAIITMEKGIPLTEYINSVKDNGLLTDVLMDVLYKMVVLCFMKLNNLLHVNNVLHGDVNITNLVIIPDKTPVIKLIDFTVSGPKKVTEIETEQMLMKETLLDLLIQFGQINNRDKELSRVRSFDEFTKFNTVRNVAESVKPEVSTSNRRRFSPGTLPSRGGPLFNFSP